MVKEQINEHFEQKTNKKNTEKLSPKTTPQTPLQNPKKPPALSQKESHRISLLELDVRVQNINKLKRQLDKEPDIGISLLQQMRYEYPELLDALTLKHAQLLIRLGRISEATSLAFEVIESAQSTARTALWLLADFAPECAQVDQALRSLSHQRSSSEHIRWLISKRLWAQRCDAERLPQIDQEIIIHHPTSQLAQLKYTQITLNFEQEFQRALMLEEHRDHQEAIKAFSQLIQREGVSEKDKWRALFERDRIQVERLRADYTKTAKRLEKLARGHGFKKLDSLKPLMRRAYLLAATAWAKEGRIKRSNNVYKELIKEWRFSAEADEARFMIAFHLYEKGQFKKAASKFALLSRHKGELKRLKRLKGRAPKRGWTRNAEWYYSWSMFQFAPKRAAPFLEKQIGAGLPLSEQGRRAAYWAAQAWSKTHPKRAASLRSQLLEAYPHDWYALLLRAKNPNMFEDILPLKWSLFPSPLDLLEQTPDSKDNHLFVRHWVRKRLLEAFGFKASAQRETQHIKKLIQKDNSNHLMWAQQFGLFEFSLRTSLGAHPARRRAIPSAEFKDWWLRVYPRGFSAEVETSSREEQVSESLILSFIRKESAFRADALSSAQAMGLMQLLQKTADALVQLKISREDPQKTNKNTRDQTRKLAQSLDLFDPQLNTRLGARYIHELSARYHEQIPLVAAGYNAGPQSLNRWLKRGDRRLDRFVELIPFKEARGYVKRLIQTYCLYQLLYGEESINQCAVQLPMELNLNVNSGVEF